MPVELNACPVETVFSLLSGKWKIPIYRYLYHQPEPVRYSQLQRHIPSISKKMLTEQLRELEKTGVIERRQIYGEARPRVDYSLTPKGRSMITFLDTMSEWGIKHIQSGEEFSEKL